MKPNILIPFLAILLFVSCNNNSFDETEAKATVALTTEDLRNFTNLKRQMMLNIIALRKDDSITNGKNNTSTWHLTNSHYLLKIDSAKYDKLLAPLLKKYEDWFEINDSGNVIFRLKQRIRMKTGDYNDTYIHEILNPEITKPHLGNIETILLDTLISSEWRYLSFKCHTGH